MCLKCFSHSCPNISPIASFNRTKYDIWVLLNKATVFIIVLPEEMYNQLIVNL